MKIAVPIAEGKLALHFGHCQHFTLINVDPDTNTITDTDVLTPPPHQPGILPAWLAEQNADLIIAGGMGARAQQLFAEHDIDVILGAPVESPQVLVLAYLEGSLQTGDNVCDH